MSIKATIRTYILENYLFTDDESELADGDSFLANHIIDSTGILELVMFLEEEFGIKVQEEDMVPDNLDTVDNLVRFVDGKRPAVAV